MAGFYEHGIDLKGRASGATKVLCPKCSHTRKNKNDKCLSVNIDEGVFNCHNCGWSGTTKEREKIEKKYVVPEVNNSKVSDRVLEWFAGRSVSKAVVMRWDVAESIEWMPQVGEQRRCINFNYFRKGKLVNVKYRDKDKNFKMFAGAELIFYGLDFIDGLDEAVICEGEIDALSFYEAGIHNVVSVPNGASKGSLKLEYLDNCWEYFEGKKKIIIATDADEPGQKLRDELARRLGKERCWFISYPEGFKDANEVLVKLGADELNKIVLNASEWPLEGISTVEDFESNIDEIYLNGFPSGNPVGFKAFDQLLRFKGGEVTVITGIPGSGKSEFTDELTIKLAELFDWRWGMFSAENCPEAFHFTKLAEKYIGKSFYSDNVYYKMTPDELGKAKLFIHQHYYWVRLQDKGLTVDLLIAKCEELVLKKGINGFLIDPWNYIEHKRPSWQTETDYISEALSKFCSMAKRLNIHVFIVAHPVKIQKEKDTGAYKVATLYDIAGSAHWFNKADNGISVYRHFDTGVVDVHVQKVRFKFMGKIGLASFTWDKWTGKYTEFEEKF